MDPLSLEGGRTNVLTEAALIREREHGTIEHLLVMPVTQFAIMTSGGEGPHDLARNAARQLVKLTRLALRPPLDRVA